MATRGPNIRPGKNVRCRALAALAFLVAIVCFLPSQALAASATPAAASAMNGLTLFHEPSDDWSPALDAMASNGVTVVRSDATWAVVQPSAPELSAEYDFSSLDSWVSALASAGLTWMPILDDTPGWAKTCTGQCPPLDMSWFDEFAQAVAARYGTNGSFWSQNPSVSYHPVTDFEIWNEENGTQFWSTGPSGAQYATMYAGARAAIKSVDPSGEAIVGGLGTGDASDFVEDMFQAMPSLVGNVDGFGLHPYEATAAEDEQDVVSFRETLDSLGEGSAPIDVTEFGWTVGPNTADEDTRAWMMDQLGSLANSNCNIGVLAPYTWVADPDDQPDYGLTSDGTDLMSGGRAWFAGLQAAASAATDDVCPGSTPTTGGSPPHGSPPSSAPRQSGAATKVEAKSASVVRLRLVEAHQRKRTQRHRKTKKRHHSARRHTRRRRGSAAHRS